MKQTAITISMINNINTSNKHDEQRMTSLEIAQLTGKRHSDTMSEVYFGLFISGLSLSSHPLLSAIQQ